MGLQLYGDATGNGIKDDASGASLHFGIDGSLILTLASGKTLVINDSNGNAISRHGESDLQISVAKVALGHADTGGGILAWQNPTGQTILISRIVVDVTTVATGACTGDFGTTATNATTSSDNLIDGIDLHTAAGLLGQADGDGTTNSKLQQKLAAGKWVTGSKASGAAAGLVGYAYIFYCLA